MKKLIIGILFLSAGLNTANAEEGITFFNGTFPEALAKAKDEHKLLFVDCFTTWCGLCKWMTAHVFTDESVYNSFNQNFISIALDMEKGEGIDIAKRYEVKNYPTYLWLDQSGNQVHRSVGRVEASVFLDISSHAMDAKSNLSYLKKQYDSGNREPGSMLIYAQSLKAAYDMRYQTVADEYFKTQPGSELTSEANWKAILEFTPNINSYTYATITKMLPSFYERYGKDSVRAVLDELALSSLSFARQQKDTLLLKNAITKLKESDNKELIKEGMNEELSYYKSNKDFIKYTELAHDYINHYFLDDPKTLNAVCWTYFMHVNEKEK